MNTLERTLLVFPPAFGLATASPFAHKAMLLLNMAGLSYEVKIGNPMRAPKGKLPVLIDHGAVVPDSGFIRLHIEQKYGFDFDRGLTAAQRGSARALGALLEDRLYWVLVYSRWFEPGNAARLRDTFFTAVPAPLRSMVFGLVRRQVRRQLRGHGMGRHSGDEIYRIGELDIAALDASLEGKPFLMGGYPTAIDATAHAFLASIDVAGLGSPLQRDVAERKSLRAYSQRCRAALEPVQPSAGTGT